MIVTTTTAPTFEAMRQAMVTSQLRTAAVSDTRVIAAMGSVPRERFVPAARQAFAYADGPIPLGRGRSLNLPMSTGRLLTEAYLRRTDRVLLIGAATGYTAALLAGIVRHVTSVEVDPELAAAAREALAGTEEVTVVEGPLEAGHPAGAPYDVLVIDGAVEQVPDALLDQVAPEGRIVAGLNDRGVTRLAAGRRSAHGFGLTDFADAECVPLPGFARPRGFSF
jgi:protein-L-isoaspartate(D-aspartate) O-methyltransferase